MKTKEEEIVEAFRDNVYTMAGLPNFEVPIIHIRNEQVPPLDHSEDVLVYAIRSMIDTNTQKVNERIVKEINKIMLKNGVRDYYGIDEKRLMEIIDEAKAFEIIKSTFSLRQALIDVCDKKSSVMPNRKKFVKEVLLK